MLKNNRARKPQFFLKVKSTKQEIFQRQDLSKSSEYLSRHSMGRNLVPSHLSTVQVQCLYAMTFCHTRVVKCQTIRRILIRYIGERISRLFWRSDRDGGSGRLLLGIIGIYFSTFEVGRGVFAMILCNSLSEASFVTHSVNRLGRLTRLLRFLSCCKSFAVTIYYKLDIGSYQGCKDIRVLVQSRSELLDRARTPIDQVTSD